MEIMEKKMETTVVYWGYMGIMENKMVTTVSLTCFPPIRFADYGPLGSDSDIPGGLSD